MGLKTKANIYKYMGIYLAEKEEQAYCLSAEYNKEFERHKLHPENDMSDESIRGLLIGSWQCHYKFYRPMSFIRYKSPAVIFKPLAWCHELYKTLKWDAEILLDKYRKL